MRNATAFLTAFLTTTFFTAPASAVLVTEDSAAGLFSHAGLKTTYDFETLTGFPDAGSSYSYIGAFDGIDFAANTYQWSGTPTSGDQVMTGNPDTFAGAQLDFSGLQDRYVIGFGFYGQDLTPDEIIRVEVDFAEQGSQTFDITLPGDSPFVPRYLGVYDSDDTITGMEIFGTDTSGADRAWVLDDLTVVTTPVPVPASAWLLFSALTGLAACARRRNRHGHY